ncbi:phosphonate metabolism transcriptional regulator PhnF [Sediminicurvatus halobius]|uniref:Phosphonate metabolism transcriptional regulator PhnF n=1 Tax=Sediminicurvatus halobius TaxID=2182432 RepID=A0A2U2MWH2_9GAMM|nr:phosphonate metabolism transcriptional regulator PhnF [Spiribacter halobius]PWG61210.1 phosphonate metabolism transcriptional regulator PhnF [Spiribacter halobius]UEX77948.1 phosphonate metabolism transcriptional regulator PhnF [Spiribacter halobius]
MAPADILWRQISNRLADEIAAGIYPPGSRLPTEAALAERFAVNRHTVRRAMAELRTRGLIRIEQGRGTFVQDTLIDYPVSRRTRFSDNVIGADRDPNSIALRNLELPADTEIAQELGLPAGSPVVLIETLRLADGRPLSVTAHYFPAARFRGIGTHFQNTGSVTQALYQMGVRDYFRDTTAVTTRLPDAWEAKHLRQPRSEPILVAHSLNVDAERRPIEYAEGRYAGRRVQFVFHPH